MKKSILLILMLPFFVIAQNKYFISSAGDNITGDGSIGNPWFGIGYASTYMSPGDTLFVRGGTYNYSTQQTINVSGAENNEVVFINYSNEEPVFDFWNYDMSGETPQQIHGIYAINKNFLKFIGLHIRRVWKINTDDGRAIGIYFQSSSDINLERIVVDSIAGRGIMGYQMSGVSSITNVDVSWCADPQDADPGNAGTGVLWYNNVENFNDTLTVTGSRFWQCADQGVGILTGMVTIFENNWVFSNGLHHHGFTGGAGLGMKTGLNSTSEPATPTTIQRNLIVYNHSKGQITNVTTGWKPVLNIYNNLFYGNGHMGIHVYDYKQTEVTRKIYYHNNISFNNERIAPGGWDFLRQGQVDDYTYNSWSCPFIEDINSTCLGTSGSTEWWMSPTEIANNSQFISVPDSTTNYTLMTAPRHADGSLPDLGDNWRLASTSEFIDAGIDVGLPFNGNAPDLGPFEYESTETGHNLMFQIENENGNAIDNATITFDGVTNAAGNYLFSNIMPGQYAYTIKAEGYDTFNGTVSISEDTELLITLNPVIPEPTYTINLSLAGSGTVTIDPLKTEYLEGETVQLTPIPDQNWEFQNWSGSAWGSDNPLTITMNNNKTITATFIEKVVESDFVIQSAGGTGTINLPYSTTSGNLLVAILAHRQDEQTPEIPEGFTLREVIQNGNISTNRHGILICDKIADGTESSFDLSFGTSSDLGGIIMEFDVQNAVYYNANSNTSGNEIPSAFTENVPMPQASYLSVAGVVSRNGEALTDWNNNFTSSASTVQQIGMAARLDQDFNMEQTVSVTNSGDQGAIIVGTWTLGEYNEDPPSYGLNTSVTGNGSVSATPQQAEYAENENVILNAIPDDGWEFVEWQGDISGSSNPETIIMNSNKNVTALFQEQIFNATFVVSDPDGVAITNATITFDGVTNTVGDYLFSDIAPGQHSYTINAEGYDTFNGTIGISEDTEITITLTPVTPESFTTTFNVYDSQGTPISNAIITFDGNTNTAGEYAFNEIISGQYNYTIVAEGYIDYNGVVNVTDNVILEVTMDENIPETYDVTFFVQDSSGNIVNNATVTLDGVSNAVGDYVFTNVSSAQYNYNIVAEGYHAVNSIITVNSDMQVDINLVENPPQTYEVSFSIADNEGNAINNATINFDGLTNEAGDYIFSDIEEGFYNYSISADGFQNVSGFDVHIDANTDFNITMFPAEAETYSINFNVIDNTGSAIENAVITFNGITNMPGDYGFSNIQSGQYNYSITAEGYHMIENTVTVNSGMQLDATLISNNQETYDVSFLITDNDGNSIDNATITFGSVSNPAGNYSFTDLEEGVYNYSISAEGFQNVSATNVALSANTNFTITMIPEEANVYNLIFQIKDNLGNNIEDAIVILNGETNPQGIYEFTDIPAGQYNYSVSANGFTTVNNTVNVNSNIQVDVNLTPDIPDSHQVLFNIVDYSGNTVEDAAVTFGEISNVEGDYIFSDVEPGIYDYNISAPGFQTISAVNIFVGSDMNFAITMFPVEENTFTVNFDIKDNAGNNINNAVVTFNNITNSAGSYSFTGIPSGNYDYTVVADGFDPIHVTNIPVSGNTTFYVTLISEQPEYYIVNFNLTNNYGEIIDDAVITFDGVSNEQGNYIFHDILAGSYNYLIEASGYETISTTNAIISGNTTFNITLDEDTPETFTITFNVKDAAGVNMPNATITFNGVTNPQGEYSFSGIEEGTYDYAVEANGYYTTSESIEISQNTLLNITLAIIPPDLYTVEFNVHDEQSLPIENAIITLNGITNNSGDYIFEDMTEGMYTYKVSAVGYEQVTNTLLVQSDLNIQVSLFEEEDDNGYTTYFTVLNHETNEQLSNAVITFNGVTNEAGNYRFENVPHGNNYYTIEADGFQSVNNQEVVIIMDNMNIMNRLIPVNGKSVEVNAYSSPSGFAFVSGSGNYPVMDSVKLKTIAADPRYEFLGWEENGQLISTEENLAFLANKDRIITARYEYHPNFYNVNAIASIEEGGTIFGTGLFEENTTTELHVTVNPGYEFKGWMNQAGQVISRQNPYEIDVVRNTEIIALLEEEYLANHESFSAYPNPTEGMITIVNPSGKESLLKVYNQQGTVVLTKSVHQKNSRISLETFPPGVYMLSLESEDKTDCLKIILR